MAVVRSREQLENPRILAWCFCSQKHQGLHPPAQIHTPPPPPPAPCAFLLLLSQRLAAQSPSRDFGRHIVLPVLPRMQGLAVMKTWAAELSRHCCVGGSSVQQLRPCSGSPPCLAGGKSGTSRFGVQRGAGSRGRGRASWSCNHGHVRE